MTTTTNTNTTNTNTTNTTAMAAGRHADTGRRRQRVLKALNDAAAAGHEISVSGIARTAGVDRTFLYRHPDLLAQLHALAAQPANAPGIGPAVSRASLHTDLLASQERASRLAARVQQLERRLSKHSDNRPGTNPGSAPPTTSTGSNNRSSCSNNKPSTCVSNSKNATKNSTPPEPPTANS